MSSQTCYPDKAPKVSHLLDALSHELRREVIHFFENYTESQTVFLDELVSHIASRVPTVSEKELEIKLVHTHLPKLARAGWLTYDQTIDRIRYFGHEDAENWLQDLRAVFSKETHRKPG